MRCAIALLVLSAQLTPWVARAQLPLQLPRAATASPRSIEVLFPKVSRVFYAGNASLALRAVHALMTSDDFASLTPDIQHPILGLEAYGLLLTEQNERAYSEFAELTNSEYATASDWIGRAESAARLGDLDDYAADVIVIIRRWPDVFAGLPPQNVSRIVSRVRQSHPGSPAYRSLLEAIATDAANTPHSANRSREWRELALEQLDAGDLEQAKLAAGHIVRVWTLISMRADRRFDTLTTSAPELFDIERDEAVAQLESASEMSEDRDSNVSQTINLAGLYARLGRTDLARATLDRVANNASDFGDAEAIAIELRAALADGDTGVRFSVVSNASESSKTRPRTFCLLR